MSLIFSSNLLSHKEGCAARRFDNTLLEHVSKVSTVNKSDSSGDADDKLKHENGKIVFKHKF